MKKYLAMILCLTVLLGNPAEAAIARGGHEEIQVENCSAQASKKETRNNTKKEAGPERKSAPRYSTADLDLLSRLVHAEAKGEPYLGKVAVAATVLNRVEDPGYPASIPEVIYEYDHGFQYCPVRNGTINFPADRQAVKAVEEALKGDDPTSGAVSFFNPAQSCNAWIRNRPYKTTIGNHVFVK